jgi:hypothetical protein
LGTAFNEFVASPVTTRARATSFNSMIAEFGNVPAVLAARRNSISGPSKNTVAKRSKVAKRTTSNGMPSPAETETTPTLKHLHKFVRSSSVDYDINGFVEEMRREKHNLMLFGDDFSISGDSDVEEKPQAKKPNSGVRRPTGAGRTPANWVPPVPGLVEVPATRLRNRQQKEKERLATATEGEPSTNPSERATSEIVSSLWKWLM